MEEKKAIELSVVLITTEETKYIRKNETYERDRYQIQDKNQDIINYPRWITIWKIWGYIEDTNMSMSLADFSRKYGIPYRTL